MIERRYPRDIVERITNARPGTRIGPRRLNEKRDLFEGADPRRTQPDTLEVIRVNKRRESRQARLDEHESAIRLKLHRVKLLEKVHKLIGDSWDLDKLSFDYFGTVRYPIQPLARRAKLLGLDRQPRIVAALERLKAEASSSEFVTNAFNSVSTKTIKEILPHNGTGNTDAEQYRAQTFFFTDKAIAEAAYTSLLNSQSVTDLVEQFDITKWGTRASRGAYRYHVETTFPSSIYKQLDQTNVEDLKLPHISKLTPFLHGYRFTKFLEVIPANTHTESRSRVELLRELKPRLADMYFDSL